MNIGMLWFDNDPKTDMTKKIVKAVDYYRSKYGQIPNLCFIHPSMLKNGVQDEKKLMLPENPIEIRTSPSVLPNHFWLGLKAPVAISELSN